MKRLLIAASCTIYLTASAAFAACVTDDTGVETCLPSPPARVISLYGAWSETLWALGAGNSIVARTKSDDTVAEMNALPVVGTGLRPNAELVMALAPDVVVARGGKAGSEALTALRERGVRVVAFDPQSLSELYGVIGKLGLLFGREDDGGRLVESMRAGLSFVAAEAAKNPKRPRVVFEVTAEPLTVAGSDGILNELISIAGGVNATPLKKRLVRIDGEALLAADPDVYLVQTGPMNQNPAPPAQRALQGQLKAVKAGRVYFVDEKIVSRPGPKVADGARELLRIFQK